MEFINWLDGVIWNPVLILLFLAAGLFYSFATRFSQVRYIKEMIVQTFKGDESKSGVSSFQALAMSLGSRVGTGNIAGVATAIALGGPGAVFWMWVMAIFGGATSFIEITITQTYKRKINGQYRGGAPFYIEKGLKMKKLALLFSILSLAVMGILWPGLQVNTISTAMQSAFGFSPVAVGAILAVFLGFIIFGGVKRIAKTAQIAVPFMAIAYLIVAAVILLANASQIPAVLSTIFSSAFGLNAAAGGTIGSAISWGVQRGAYSNGAGVGSETFEGAAAEVSHPAKQGLVQSFSVYIDTLLICSATAFIIIITGVFNTQSANPELYAQTAVDAVFPGFGAAFLAISLLFFCFTTVISYYYKAETNLAYLHDHLSFNAYWSKNALRIILIAVAFWGSVQSAELAWGIANIGLGSMAWVNLITILLLTKPALAVFRDYERQKNEGKNPVFNPIEAGVEGAVFWENRVKERNVVNKKVTVPASKQPAFKKKTI